MSSFHIPFGSIVYSYFMAKMGTVKLLSRCSGEDLGNCCQRPKAQGSGKLLPEAEGRGQQFPRSSPLHRDNNLTVPQVALEYLFYYSIVLNHRNTVNSTPMLVVDVGTFDVSWRHLLRDQSIVHYCPVNSFFLLQAYPELAKLSCNNKNEKYWFKERFR